MVDCPIKTAPQQTILLQGRFPPRIQRSQGVGQMPAHWICYSRPWSHSQLFLFSSQFSQYPAASHSLFSFSLSTRHLRFLQLPARQEGHSCFSSSSGQRDKVLERAEMKGELSVSLCSSASCSSEASSALKETSSLLLLAKERSRDWSCFSSRSTSGFLWLLPTWTFRPRWESDVNSHWSHLNLWYTSANLRPPSHHTQSMLLTFLLASFHNSTLDTKCAIHWKAPLCWTLNWTHH